MIQSLIIILAIVTGLAFGLAFGYLQEFAAEVNERRQREGRLTSGWAVMPGSFTRVAYLLVALAAAQLFCPAVFEGATKWCVSVGLTVGYGLMQYRRLMRRRKALGL